MTLRRATGQGTVYRRKDGRYEAAAYVMTSSGRKKRIRVYAKSRAAAHTELAGALERASKGIPAPDRSWRLDEYLDYWLTIVEQTKRPTTHRLYESLVRNYLRPGLGSRRLVQLTLRDVQSFLDDQLRAGCSIRTAQKQRAVLSAALTRAQREELFARNVARLVELPTWHRKKITPWTADQLQRFYRVAQGERYYAAFVLLGIYGLRSGEVRGLSWEDIDMDNGRIHIRRQMQHQGNGLRMAPVKTSSSERDLPLLGMAIDALTIHRSTFPAGDSQLVFTSPYGNPVDEWTLLRAFRRISKGAELPIITVHQLRHTTVTLLKNLGVPDRDAQLIFGHSTSSITRQIYQHADISGQFAALDRLQKQLSGAGDSSRSRQIQPSNTKPQAFAWGFVSGGPSGIRTHDTRLKSLQGVNEESTLTEVLTFAQMRILCQALGIVAVNSSRQVIGHDEHQGCQISVLAKLRSSMHGFLEMCINPKPLNTRVKI